MTETGKGLLESLLQTEVGAARLEGAFAADPDLGVTWRAQEALTEAVRSVGLEGVVVGEGDVALRSLDARAGASETARGAWLASEVFRLLRNPPDPFRDIESAVSRCVRAGANESGEVGPEGVDIEDLKPFVSPERSPLISALRGAVAMRDLTFSANPAAERLFFMSLDSAARGGRAGRDDVLDPGILETGFSFGRGANWVLMPSAALSSDGFRPWSPGSPKGLRDLLSGLESQVGRGLGALPGLRRWRSRAVSASGARHGKSRFQDLVRVLMERPIVSAPAVAELIGVTSRTGLNLLKEAEEAGVVKLVTPRRSYRAWAATPMAERVRGRVTAPGKRGPVPVADAETGFPEQDRTASPPRTSQETRGEAEALEELDAAMAAADRVLSRIGKKRDDT